MYLRLENVSWRVVASGIMRDTMPQEDSLFCVHTLSAEVHIICMYRLPIDTENRVRSKYSTYWTQT